MITIAVCDDNPHDLTLVSRYVEQYYSNVSRQRAYSLDTYQHSGELSGVSRHYDIYLLDIFLPELGGIELGQKIRSQDKKCEIIFMTVSQDYALSAFGVDAAGYLVKPFEEQRFYEVFNRAEEAVLHRRAQKINVPTKNGTSLIEAGTITFVEHYRHVLFFHLTNGSVIQSANSSMTLAEAEGLLAGTAKFLSPHRAFLINMDQIASMDNREFRLKNNASIPIAQRRYREIKEQYMSYLLYKGR